MVIEPQHWGWAAAEPAPAGLSEAVHHPGRDVLGHLSAPSGLRESVHEGHPESQPLSMTFEAHPNG